VTVSGFPFLRGDTRTISVNRLVAKILCRKHNEALSEVDTAAGHFFNVMRAFRHRAAMRAKGYRKPGGIDMYDVDGFLVERWMLKTIINLMVDQPLRQERWRPDDVWVRCAYGLAPFPDRCGLYLLADNKYRKASPDSGICIWTLTKGKNADLLTGGHYKIEEAQFAITMAPLAGAHQPLYRLRALKDKPALELRQIINFRW
jgi:hypothetical protein